MNALIHLLTILCRVFGLLLGMDTGNQISTFFGNSLCDEGDNVSGQSLPIAIVLGAGLTARFFYQGTPPQFCVAMRPISAPAMSAFSTSLD